MNLNHFNTRRAFSPQWLHAVPTWRNSASGGTSIHLIHHQYSKTSIIPHPIIRHFRLTMLVASHRVWEV